MSTAMPWSLLTLSSLPAGKTPIPMMIYTEEIKENLRYPLTSALDEAVALATVQGGVVLGA